MAIVDDLAQIRQAVYGAEVREAIASGIEECYTDVQSGVTAADTAAASATSAASGANNAASAATTAASAANTAAGKINDMTVAANGLPAGSSPTVAISEVSGHKHIVFGLVQGAKGDAGKDFHIAKTFASIAAMQAYTGTDIEAYDFAMIDTGSVQDADTGKLYCYEPETQDVWRYIGDLSGAQGIKGDKGDKGDPGATPAFSIGTVGTLTPGSSATASITGTAAAPVLNLGIPKGDTGTTPAFSIGTVSTLSPSSPATASIGGTAAAPVLNLGIPKGDTGSASNMFGTTIEMSENDSTKLASAIGAKADKVSSATSGNFAALDSNGNLTDSGKKASDFLTQHQDISGKVNVAQGSANSGKILGINSSGNVTPVDPPAGDVVGVKVNGSTISPDQNGIVDIGIVQNGSNYAYVENTNTATHAIDEGQYVLWYNLLYTATDDIAIGDTLSTSTNLLAVTGGGLNDLLDKIGSGGGGSSGDAQVWDDVSFTIATTDWTLDTTNNVYTAQVTSSKLTSTAGVFMLWDSSYRTAVTDDIYTEKTTGYVTFTTATVPVGTLTGKMRIIDSTNGTIAVNRGGTGAQTVPGARANLNVSRRSIAVTLNPISVSNSALNDTTSDSRINSAMQVDRYEASNPEIFKDAITFTPGEGTITITCSSVNGQSTMTVYMTEAETVTPSGESYEIPATIEAVYSNLNDKIGDLDDLTTTEDGSLVGALNELVGYRCDINGTVRTVKIKNGSIGSVAHNTQKAVSFSTPFPGGCVAVHVYCTQLGFGAYQCISVGTVTANGFICCQVNSQSAACGLNYIAIGY